MVPAMMYLLGIQIHKAIGISLAVIVPTAMIGCFRHFQAGNFDTRIAVFIAAGSLAGAWFGASLAQTIDAATLKRLFGVLLVLVGLNLALAGSPQSSNQNPDSKPGPGNAEQQGS